MRGEGRERGWRAATGEEAHRLAGRASGEDIGDEARLDARRAAAASSLSSSCACLTKEDSARRRRVSAAMNLARFVLDGYVRGVRRHSQVGWGWAQVARFTFAFSRMTSLSSSSLRLRSAFCIFSWSSTGLTGGGTMLRRSWRDDAIIEIEGDGLTVLVAGLGRILEGGCPIGC